MYHLGKATDYCQYGVVTFRGGRPLTKSKAMWDHRQGGMGKGCRSPAESLWEDLFVCAHCACSNKGSDIRSHGWPPEALLDEATVQWTPGW